MEISFIGPAIEADDGGVAYRAKLDGKTISCRFTAECLEDANPRLIGLSPVRLFEANSGKLLEIAHRKIRENEVESGVVWIFSRDL